MTVESPWRKLAAESRKALRFSKAKLLDDLDAMRAKSERYHNFDSSNGRSQVLRNGIDLDPDELIEFGRYEMLLELIEEYQ
jgi:hypothetical protein